MVATVRVEDAAKSRLEELQAEIRLGTGQTVTQQELLAWLINNAYESREAVIDSFRKSTFPLSDAEKQIVNEAWISSATETDEADIDDILY